MRSPFERLSENVLRDAVAGGWGLALRELRYFPEGGGAYHWTAATDVGQALFVTCDDLDTKPWLGGDRDAVFDGLLAAYATAMELRASGAAFVVAAIASRSGSPAERVDERHAISVFEHVDGQPGQWGRPLTSRVLEELVEMLATLHRSTAPARTADQSRIEVPGREELDGALGDLDHAWDGGPLSDLTRQALAANADLIAGWLADFDRFALGVEASHSNAVVTHGEPHPGNLILTKAGLRLVDWDTVALAPPERDLWMVAGRERLVAAYQDRTGTTLDRDALAVYRLQWALEDVAAFTVQLRGEHRRDADSERALAGLRSILEGAEPAPYG